MIKTASAAEALDNVDRLAKRLRRISDRANKGRSLPKNGSKPNTETQPVSFPWWAKEA